MKIFELYFNEYKQSNLTKNDQRSISNKMLKYIIGSCFKKMYRRAFHWASCFMICCLSSFTWDYFPAFSSDIKPDHRLSTLLNTTTIDGPESNNQTFGKWVMTYHPDHDKHQNELPSLDDFLTPTSGSSNYQFDQNIARVFHSLLLSSLYVYLCLMEQLLQSTKTAKEEQIRRNVGSFSNAVQILYFVSHSNAMKACFTLVGLPLLYPVYRDSGYYKNQLRYAIHTKLNLPIMPEAYDYGDGDSDPQENYVEDFKENNVLSIYRRSFMSFVDHYASLHILERRSSRLPADATIKLSLFAVRHPKNYYFLWEEMDVT